LPKGLSRWDIIWRLVCAAEGAGPHHAPPNDQKLQPCRNGNVKKEIIMRWQALVRQMANPLFAGGAGIAEHTHTMN
jgi:hypothetical protein